MVHPISDPYHNTKLGACLDKLVGLWMADSVWMVLGLWCLNVTASLVLLLIVGYFGFLLGWRDPFTGFMALGELSTTNWDNNCRSNDWGQGSRWTIPRRPSRICHIQADAQKTDAKVGSEPLNGAVSARVPGAPVNQSSKLTRIRKSQCWKPFFLTFWTWFVSQWWFSGSNYVEFIWEVKNLDWFWPPKFWETTG